MNISIATVVTAMTIGFATSVGCGVAAASPGSPANRESLSDPHLTAVVHFADLDISSMEGTKRLYVRLRSAAAEVCEPLESASAWGASEHRACINEAIADAVATINRPLLSQYHRSQTKTGTRVVKLAEAE